MAMPKRRRCTGRAGQDFFFFGATFLPFLRASDSPMAIACFLLVTFLPLPLFSVPAFRLCIADLTSLEALFDVLRAAMAFLLRGRVLWPQNPQISQTVPRGSGGRAYAFGVMAGGR